MSTSIQTRILIPTTVEDKCSLQCMFWYDFMTSDTTDISDDTKSLQLTYDGPGSNVMYNSTVYKLATTAIHIYVGGIHTFESNNNDGPSLEIVINLVDDNNRKLYICIPIGESGATSATNAIKEIIDAYFTTTSTTTTTTTTTTAIDGFSPTQFNLNYIIPKSPFIVHTGIYHNSSDSYATYVVFPYPSFNLSQTYINKVTLGPGHLNTYEFSTSAVNVNPPMFQSEQGTTVNGFSGTGQIYIDCQPTDEEGEIVVKQQIVPSSFYKFNMSGLIYLIVMVISCIVLISLYQKVKNFFTLNSP